MNDTRIRLDFYAWLQPYLPHGRAIVEGVSLESFFVKNNNNGPNRHLFYVGGDLMMRRGMLPIIMLPNGDLRIALHLVPFWIMTIWGSVHIEETVVGWRNQLRMKTSAT